MAELPLTPEDAASDLNSAREVIRRLRGERDRMEFERDAAEIGSRQQLIEICRAAGEERAARGDIDDAAGWLEKAVAIAEQARHNPRLAVRELDPAGDKRRLDLLRFMQRTQGDAPPFSLGSEGRRILITVAVCNRREADLIGGVLAPCALAAGNLPALSADKDVVFQIFTTAFLKPFLTRSASLRALHQFCRVSFDLFPSSILAPSPSEWQVGREMATLSIRQARAAEAGLIVLRPDMVFSNNLFATLAEASAGGADAVLTVLPGVKAAEIAALVSGRDDETSCSFPPEDLAELALANLSQRTLAHVASPDNDFYFPDSLQLLWQDEGGVVFHSAEPHPIYLAEGVLTRDRALPWIRFGANLIGSLIDEPFSGARLIDSLETCGAYLLEAPTALPAAYSFFDPYSFGQKFWRRCDRFERWVFNHRVHLRGSYRIPYAILNGTDLAAEEERVATGLGAYQRSMPVAVPPAPAPPPRRARPPRARIDHLDATPELAEAASSGAYRVESTIVEFAAGLHTLAIGELAGQAGILDGIATPAVRIAAAPSAGRAAIEFIPAAPAGGFWLGGEGGTIALRAGADGGRVLVTAYGCTGVLPAIDLRRIEPGDRNPAVEIEASLTRPQAAAAAEPLRLEVTAHIERLGNRSFAGGGWVGGGSRKLRVEAFAIRPLERLSSTDIQYRAIGPLGRETPWVTGAALCGTRGQALPLTGFAIRLAPHLGDRYDVVYEGQFFEYGVTGPSRNGEICRSPIADDALTGLNIRLIERRDSSRTAARDQHQAVA